MTNNTRPPRLGHVAISAREPDRVAAFYRELLDLQIVRQASGPLTGDAVLLSGDPAREDHELVVLANHAAEHIAFRVHTVKQLRVLYTRAKQRGMEIPYALDSSVAVGFFIRDPEQNAVEIYLARSKPGHDRPLLTSLAETDRLILGSHEIKRKAARDV